MGISKTAKWATGIGGTIILGLITNEIDRKVNYSKITNWTTHIFNVVYNAVFQLLNYPVRLWIVFIIAILIIFGCLLLVKKRLNDQNISASNPAFLKYTKDIFGIDNTAWVWKYDLDNSTYEVSDVKPLCKICQTPMRVDAYPVGYTGTSYAECSKCRLEGRNYSYNVKQQVLDVEAEIIRRVKSNEYLGKIPNN